MLCTVTISCNKTLGDKRTCKKLKIKYVSKRHFYSLSAHLYIAKCYIVACLTNRKCGGVRGMLRTKSDKELHILQMSNQVIAYRMALIFHGSVFS